MDVIIETKHGKIKGFQKDDHQEFLGIRYAKPPVGKLRFQKPQPSEPWEGIYDATKYGPIAPQAWQDDPPIKMEESEDCLFLNIYTPWTDDKGRPVMFYIHGGALAIGSGSRRRLYGGKLAEHGDVVVVTIQYRLGILGFLDADGILPNLGLQDQVCALQWVKDNIRVFGGDPDNVTIFGQSAGGTSVSYLLVMPQAKGLFHRAIAQSGSIPLFSENPSEELLLNLKVKQGDVEALQALTLEQLIAAQKKITGGDIFSGRLFYPVTDGTIIPGNVYEALASEFARDVPLLIGVNEDEVPIFGYFLKSWYKRYIGKFFVNRFFKKKYGLEKRSIKQFLEFYRKNLVKTGHVPNKEYDKLLTDVIFRIPAIKQAEIHSSASSGTYFYIFTHKAPRIDSAVHILELFFIFGTLDTDDVSRDMQPAGSEEDKQLAKKMMDTWVTFARTGNPSHPSLPEWPAYDTEKRATMVLDTSPRVINMPTEEERAIWGEYLL
ncbi:MAG: carboxylesterase/lipase family protein [Candidatus Odinarchaeota archaeon]